MISIDEWSNKRIGEYACLKWLIDHRTEIQRYLDETYVDTDDKIDCWRKFLNNPFLAKEIIRNYNISPIEKYEKVIQSIFSKPTINTIIGKKGTGKSVLAFSLCEEAIKLKKDLNFCVWGTAYIDKLPDYYEIIIDLSQIKNNSVVVFDEAAVYANARQSMSKDNIGITQLMAISRHKDCTLIYASQHSSALDVNIWRMSDNFLLKPLTWEETTSSEDTRSKTFMEYVKALYPNEQNKRETLLFNGEEWTKFELDKPKWWSETISKSFTQLTEEQGIILAKRWFEKGLSEKKILSELKLRGINWTEDDLNFFLNKK